ncbi:MAG: phage major capsid protein [Candidatus Nanopelagicales bacterium]
MTDTSIIPTADDLRTRHESRHGTTADQSLADQMHEARQAHDDALEGLHRQAGDRALTASEQRRWDAHTREARALDEAATAIERQLDEARAQRVASRRARWGSVQVSANTPSRGAAWDNLDRGDSPAGWVNRANSVLEQRDSGLARDASERLADALATREGPAVAQFLVARSNPDYQTGFLKLLSHPDPQRALFTMTPGELAAMGAVEATRASLGTGTSTGGYLIPLSLDPNLAAIANDGAASPFRQLATVRTTASSPHRAVTSAGVTASWVAENTAIGDASPTFVGVDVPLFKAAAFVTGSYELFADAGAALAENLPPLLADARNILEAAAFVTGNGTSAPEGIITAISATVASTVTCTTRGQFTSASTVDTLALYNALPARVRQSRSVASFANNTTVTKIRQQGVGTSGAMLTDMSEAVPRVLGVPLHEASSVTAATTSGSIIGVAGDLGGFLIVDHVQGPSMEFVQNAMDGDGLPTGTRGWVYWSRTGARVLDPARWRFLLA